MQDVLGREVAWWAQPQWQLMELDLSPPQAPGEMTQLPVIKAEPQEVNQFLKVTPGKVSREGLFSSLALGRQHSYSLDPAHPPPLAIPSLPRIPSPPCLAHSLPSHSSYPISACHHY